MDEITQFVSDYSKRLGRQINDLEDVRNAMAALEDIRQNEIRIDMILGPIEVWKRFSGGSNFAVAFSFIWREIFCQLFEFASFATLAA